jgi:hypothetical protein
MPLQRNRFRICRADSAAQRYFLAIRIGTTI